MGRRFICWSLVICAAVSGCGSGSTKTVTVTVDSSGDTVGTSTSTGKGVDAKLLVGGLRCAGLPIDGVQVYGEKTDPNHSLGRPGEYVSKANWTDARITGKDRLGNFDPQDGGSVETFDDEAAAKKRLAYLQSLSGQVAGTNEYDTLLGGLTLLRVSETLTPDQADAYKQAAERLVAEPGSIGKNCATPQQPAAVKPLPANASPYVGGNASPTLPAGTQGKVTVVEAGPYSRDDGSTPIIVRNMTDQAVTQIDVQGVVSEGGAPVLTGQSQGIRPAQLEPGEIGIGYVYFNGRNPPAGAKTTFTVDSTPASDSYQTGPGDLRVDSAQNTGDQIAGFMTNMSKQPITGPISLHVACFSPSGQLTRVERSFNERDKAAPGERIAYSIDLTNFGTSRISCPSFLVAGGGFQQ